MLAKFIGGPWGGRELDAETAGRVGVYTPTPNGFRLLMPPVALGFRILCGEVTNWESLGLYNGGGAFYERVLLPDGQVQLHHRPEAAPAGKAG
jgi:hypothetical protein